MQAKIANVIDCLRTEPLSKRAVIPIPFNSEGSQASIGIYRTHRTQCDVTVRRCRLWTGEIKARISAVASCICIWRMVSSSALALCGCRSTHRPGAPHVMLDMLMSTANSAPAMGARMRTYLSRTFTSLPLCYNMLPTSWVSSWANTPTGLRICAMTDRPRHADKLVIEQDLLIPLNHGSVPPKAFRNRPIRFT